jgi:hypothetical protein
MDTPLIAWVNGNMGTLYQLYMSLSMEKMSGKMGVYRKFTEWTVEKRMVLM